MELVHGVISTIALTGAICAIEREVSEKEMERVLL
jgi:hypothetical protein